MTSEFTHFQQKFSAGISQMGLSLPKLADQKLFSLLELLIQWNRVHNLTAVRHFDDMIDRHLLDSLVAMPYLAITDRSKGKSENKNRNRVCDVGTGPGFPGLPLAIALPEVEFVLLDAVLKKIQFVQQAIATLGLQNVTAVHTRVEHYSADPKFDWIVSRALTDLGSFVRVTDHLAAKAGKWLVWKANLSTEEKAAVPSPYRITEIQPVLIPGEAKKRVLVFIERANE